MLSNNINLRKIGVMFLIFTLVFTGLGVSSGMPVSYAASSEVYVSSGGDDTNGDGTVGKPYATLPKAYTAIADGGTGTIYLLDDMTQTTKNGEALKLNLDKRVTITTAPGVNTVTIKRGEPSGTNALDTHFDLTKGELTLKNIIIDSSFNNQQVNGRIVNVFGGSQLIIEEGAVLRGSNSGFSGSVIHVDNAGSVVVMKGGEIRGNNSTGAAVLVDNGSQFIMTGGLITDNIGGGVSFRSTPGGMLLLSGDARITGNTNSSGKALNVNMANYKNLILDGVFTGEAGITTQSILPGTQFGQATDAGLGSIENLIADSGSILASYDENKNLVWRSFKNELSQPSTDGEIMGKKPTLSGVTEPLAKVTIKIVSEADQSIVVSKEVTADGNGDWVLPVDMVLSTGAYTISVTANKNKTQSEIVNRQFIVSSDVYVSSGGNDTTGDGTRNHPYATLYKAYQEVNDGGTIYVMNNIVLSVTADKKYLHLDQTKSVTISTDPDAVDTAVIQRGSGKDAASGESGDIDTPIRLEKGQLTLKNIIIDAKLGEDFYRGRIINVYNDSKLIIEEGAILRNSSSSFGGTAIYLKGTAPQKAVIEMRGGEITGNKHSTSEHSAVLIVDNADFIMSGGKITDNSGGGVELSTNTNTRLVLSGTAQITGNRGSSQPERNVILQGTTFLTLNDDFSGEAGITAYNRMTAGSKFGVAARAGLTGLENLFSDNGHLLASYAAGNNDLVWKLFKNELSQPSTNGEKTGTNPTLSGVTEPFAKVMIKIISAADPSVVITEERTADANGKWEFPVDKALSTGAYTINVTANINNNQSETVTRQFEVVDKTALQGKYDEITAENLVEAEYTEASWKALNDAMTKAKEVLDNPAATQDEVNTALAALEKARNELTPVDTVDKTTLQKKLDEIAAENLVETEYTEASWKALNDAMTKAKEVLDNPAATQDEVDAALTALEQARQDLTEKTVDKTALQRKYDEITAENLVEAEYTEASWKALNDAITKAKEVLDNPTATQDEVNTALAALEKARNELTPVDTVDKTTLQKKLDEIAAENLVETEYTEASWKALHEAMNAAKDVLGDPTATQDEVNTALAALEKARNELTPVVKVDKTALQNKVDEITAENLVETEYTEASWKALQEAMNAAKDVLGDPTATQDEVDKALAALKQAEKDLVKLGGELDDLNLLGLTNGGNREIELTPPFDPNQNKNYYGTVANDVYGISLNPVAKYPDDTQVKIIVNGLEYSADKWNKLPLIEGENVITVGVYDKAEKLINEYTYIIVRERASGNDNSGGDNTGGSNNGGGNSDTVNPTTPPTTDNTVKPGNIVITINGSNVSFASGTVNGGQTTVTIDKDKLSGILADGKEHKFGISVPGNGNVEVQGLTVEDLKKLADTGSSLEIEDVLAIYPVPAGQLDVNAISKQFGNAPISDIAANIKIKRSGDELAKLAREKAAQNGYELLVHPVDLDLAFMHDGKTDRTGLLNGYAPKYIAIPEGVDPNRITTGVIVNPDGTVFHVPSVVTKVNNRYFALINDLRSSGTYSVIWNPQDFEDVKSHWGKQDVNNIAARLSLKGNGNNTFSPNRYVTRSEFAEIVVLGLGLMRQDASQAKFSDVPASIWYKDAVSIANEFDIVRGYNDSNFKGGLQITREQGFAMIARAYRLIQSEDVPNQEQIATTLAQYTDGANVAPWAKADVTQLIHAGIIQGNGPEALSPKAQMTRAEVTALIARMLKVTNLIDK